MQTNYDKCLVVDFDDTISFTTNRDFANAKPNIKLIEKLNSLRSQGWTVRIFTARGHLSCKTRSEAVQKNKSVMETWLKKHNVQYDELSFQKPLATYYIDDKAIRPEEFINLTIEELTGGHSGARIERRDNRVYKTASNSLEAANWYVIAKDHFDVPNVFSLIGETICMEYIKPTDNPEFSKCINIIDSFKLIKRLNIPDFDTYVNRIFDHLNLFPYSIDGLESSLKLISKPMNELKTFCHGDFTVDNILNSDNTHYLIDPIYINTLFSSWLLDASKYALSLKLNNQDENYNKLYKHYEQYTNAIKLLELTQWIRIRTYNDFESKKRTDIEIKKLIEEINETRLESNPKLKIR